LEINFVGLCLRQELERIDGDKKNINFDKISISNAFDTPSKKIHIVQANEAYDSSSVSVH